MEEFIRSVVPDDSVFFRRKIKTEYNLCDSTNNIELLQKLIFKQDILSEWETLLTSMSCEGGSSHISEETTISEIIRRTVTELVTLVSSNSEENDKAHWFCIIFRAFSSVCKDEQSKVAIQFFMFLCHILGINELLKSDGEVLDRDLTFFDDQSFGSFGVKILPCTQTSVVLLKKLLCTLIKESKHVQDQFVGPCLKWLERILLKIIQSEDYHSHSIEMMCITLDINPSIVERLLEEMLIQNYARNENLDDNFHICYRKFLDKALITFANYQRLANFISSFLSILKVIPKSTPSEAIFPNNLIGKFRETLQLFQTNQLKDILTALLKHLKEVLCQFTSKQKSFNSLYFEVCFKLLIEFLKGLKVCASGLVFKSYASLVQELDHLNDALLNFGSFLVAETKFTLKHEMIFRLYLDLAFHYYEVQSLYLYYSHVFSQSSTQKTWTSYIDIEQWNLLTKNYYCTTSESCHPYFLQIALQRVRLSKLFEAEALCPESMIDILSTLGRSKDGATFEILGTMCAEDINLCLEILPKEKSKCVIRKFLKSILNSDDVQDKTQTVKKIFENPVFCMCAFQELLVNVDSMIQKASKKYKCPIREIMEFNGESLLIEDISQLPKAMNTLLLKHKTYSQLLVNSPKNLLRLGKIVEIFLQIPFMHMNEDWKALGLAFSLELAILLSAKEDKAVICFEKFYASLGFEIDLEKCFKIEKCFKWLSEIYLSDNGRINNLKLKLIEKLVDYLSRKQTGLSPLISIIEKQRESNESVCPKLMAVQLLIAEKFVKSSVENEVDETCFAKLTKFIKEDFNRVGEPNQNGEHCELMFKAILMELRDGRSKRDTSEFLQSKLLPYITYAVNKLKQAFDEVCSDFLFKLVKSISKIRHLVPEDFILTVWSVLKNSPTGQWKVFITGTTDADFQKIMSDLLVITKEYLKVDSSIESPAYFQIWKIFLELSSNAKRQKCEMELKKFFKFIGESQVLLLPRAQFSKKINLITWTQSVLACKGVMTPEMLQVTLELLITCSNNQAMSNQEFSTLFIKIKETVALIQLKFMDWNKSNIQLNFVLFKNIVSSLSERSDVNLQLSDEDIFYLTDCGHVLEKSICQLIALKKDYSRICSYFIDTIVSCITTVTVSPPVKLHLHNCVFHLLSMMDSYSIENLLRAQAQGSSQVFINLYNKYKKHHKYSGKV